LEFKLKKFIWEVVEKNESIEGIIFIELKKNMAARNSLK
jgi:hypothetical protein